MRRIYSAASPPEAHLLRGYLEAAGIPAVVQGEHAYSARGGLPIDFETLPSVWVAEGDAERAAELTSEFFAEATEQPGPEWRCPRCGELLEAQFTDCWNCGTSRVKLEN